MSWPGYTGIVAQRGFTFGGRSSLKGREESSHDIEHTEGPRALCKESAESSGILRPAIRSPMLLCVRDSRCEGQSQQTALPRP